MKSTKFLVSAGAAAALALAFSACGNSANTSVNVSTTTVNTANANNSNTATAVNSNQTAVNKTTPASNNSAVYSPEKNSPERKAIFDALREPVSKELKQDVSFIADKFNVQGDWAFIAGKVRNADGGEPNWKITKYQEFIESGDFEDNLFALLKKKDDKWTVVTYLMNCLDVCYLEWDKEHKAPKAILK